MAKVIIGHCSELIESVTPSVNSPAFEVPHKLHPHFLPPSDHLTQGFM